MSKERLGLKKFAKSTSILLLAAATCSGTISKPSFDHQSERDPNQKIGMINYGHRGAEIIRETGDIAQGFVPVNGQEYGVADRELLYEKARQWKHAHLDWVAISWDEGYRDQFIRFLLDTQERDDFPHPNLEITIINEKLAFSVQSQEEIAADLDNLNDVFTDDDFLENKDGQATFFVFVHPFQLIDDPDYLRKIAEESEKRDLWPIVQQSPFSEFDSNAHRVGWFKYYDPYAFPTGVLRTDDAFTITYGYQKSGDIKSLSKDYDRIRQNLREAIESDIELVVGVSDGEGAEYSEADNIIFDIYNEEIPPRN